MEERQFINRTYIKSLFPTALSVLLIQLCSVFNNIVVGSVVGADGLAVMSIVNPVGFIFATVGSLVAVGGSIQSAHCLGNQNDDGSNRSLFTALKILAICGVAFTLAILIFNSQIAALLGTPTEISKETKKYLIAFAPAAFAAMGIYIPFNFLKIHGAQRYAVYVSFAMLISNIGFDFLFAKVLDMGMAGIGLASTLSYWLSAFPGILLLFGKKGGYKLPKQKSKKGFDRSILAGIVTSGSPSAVNNLCHLLRSYFMNLIIVAAIGKAGLSTFSIISTTFMLSVTITNGTSLTMAPFAAVFSSQKDNTSLRQIFAVSIVSAIVLMTGFSAFVAFFPETVCRIFSMKDIGLISDTSRALKLYAVSLIVSAVNTIFSTFYQSVKRTVCANILTVSRNFAGVVIFAFIISKLGKPENIWLGFLLAEIFTLAITFAISFITSRVSKNTSSVLMIDTAAEKEGRYLAFSVERSNEKAAESAEKVKEFCEHNDLPPKITMAIGLSIEEILISFNEHALADGNKNIRTNVRILIYKDVIVLRFRAGGKPFDPIKYAEEDTEFASDSMGIKMIQKLAETVLYDRVFGLNNLTILF